MQFSTHIHFFPIIYLVFKNMYILLNIIVVFGPFRGKFGPSFFKLAFLKRLSLLAYLLSPAEV